jgi:hypothetical protein
VLILTNVCFFQAGQLNASLHADIDDLRQEKMAFVERTRQGVQGAISNRSTRPNPAPDIVALSL